MRFLRLSTAVALALTALLTTVRVGALGEATVTQQNTFGVVSTDAAVLEIAPGTGDGNAAGTAAIAGGALTLDFTRGYLGSPGYGFAPPSGSAAGDIYWFRGVFQVHNAASGSRCIAVHVPGGGAAGLAAIYGRPASDPGGPATLLAGAGGSQAGCISLGGGETLLVDFHWSITSASPASSPFTIRVDAQP